MGLRAHHLGKSVDGNKMNSVGRLKIGGRAITIRRIPSWIGSLDGNNSGGRLKDGSRAIHRLRVALVVVSDDLTMFQVIVQIQHRVVLVAAEVA